MCKTIVVLLTFIKEATDTVSTVSRQIWL